MLEVANKQIAADNNRIKELEWGYAQIEEGKEMPKECIKKLEGL